MSIEPICPSGKRKMLDRAIRSDIMVGSAGKYNNPNGDK